MKNLKQFNEFLLEEEKIGDSELQKHLKAQQEFDKKIEDLTGKLKKALDDSDVDPKEINKMKLAIKILKLEKELEDSNYKMSKFDDSDK